MKLAEALINRADLQRRMNALEIRLNNNARVQEGEVPAEDPMLLLSELMEVTQQLEDLVTRINLTNSQTLDGDDTLTGLLAQRDIRGAGARHSERFSEQRQRPGPALQPKRDPRHQHRGRIGAAQAVQRPVCRASGAGRPDPVPQLDDGPAGQITKHLRSFVSGAGI